MIMLLYCIIFLIVVLYWPTSLYWKDNVLWARGISNYLDWPVHFAQVTKIKFQNFSDWFSQSPFLINTKNTYPFWADIPSGLLYRAGLDFKTSFLLPSILYTLFFLHVLWNFLRKRGFTENMTGAVLALFLFASMPYSPGTQPQVWLNLMSANRAILITFPFILIIYDVFETAMNQSAAASLRKRISTCIQLLLIVFITCLIHPHSLLSMAVVAAIFSIQILRKTRKIPWELIAWGLFSLPIILCFKNSLWSEATFEYPKFAPLWTSNRFGVNPLLYWPVYGGFVYLLGVVYAIYKKQYTVLTVIISLCLIHILFQWQPNEYDNIKNTLLIFFACSYLIVKYTNKKLLYLICFVCVLPSLKEWFEVYPLATQAEVNLAAELQAQMADDHVAVIDNRHNHFIPMFTTIQVLAWWDYYNWTFGLANKPEMALRYNALMHPSEFSYHKPLLLIVRDEGSYSGWEMEGRYRGLGPMYSFNQLDLRSLPYFKKEAGYTIFKKWAR